VTTTTSGSLTDIPLPPTFFPPGCRFHISKDNIYSRREMLLCLFAHRRPLFFPFSHSPLLPEVHFRLDSISFRSVSNFFYFRSLERPVSCRGDCFDKVFFPRPGTSYQRVSRSYDRNCFNSGKVPFFPCGLILGELQISFPMCSRSPQGSGFSLRRP